MPRIILQDGKLGGRQLQLQKLLRPIAKVSTGPSCKVALANTAELVLATFDGAQPITGHHRDWRFRTKNEQVRAQYFERWMRTGQSAVFLDRAYLHLFRDFNHTEHEILCLHCDPNEPDAAAHARYKQGPHLHLSMLGSTLRHPHVALEYGFLGEILRSPETLTLALERAITMISEQFLMVL